MTFHHGITTLRSGLEAALIVGALLLPTHSAHADEALQYDERGNVQTRTVDGRTSTYRYDPLDRLKSETGKTNQSFGLDANGNRTADANATYTVLANGNRLITRNGITLSYDPAGNLLSDQAKINGVTVTRSFGYGPAGTLKTVAINGTPTASYIYDGRWMRMRKTLANPPPGTPAITLYRYDPYGKISEEISGSGANAGQTLVTYIWKDDIPSAVIYAPGTPSNTGTIERIVYLHADHLNTPRKASDSQGRIVWSWESDAFGSTAPNEDVDGDGQKTIINLRLPGQYFDAESGLHYNWHRYYDPQVGRYTQPDPIGLAGGINPYQYANAAPTMHSDPTGLFVPLVIPGICAAGGCEALIAAGIVLMSPPGQKAIGDLASKAGESCSPGDPDPCKGLRDQINAHEKKLKDYVNNPLGPSDNTNILNWAVLANNGAAASSIYEGRIRNLQKQIANFRRQLEECERRNGKR